MSSLISVVIPIYNVSKWLPGCLHNILQQSINEIEIILVNDGSTDNSGEICNSYGQLDKRIIVIHKQNGGLSSARNAGIKVATGKYIVFIDPDDKICEDYLSVLYNAAEENDCDAVVSGYMTVPNNQEKLPGYIKNTVMDGKAFVLSSPIIHTNNDLCFVWRNIYKLKNIKINNIRFNEQVFIGEDVIFNLEFFLKSERIIALNQIMYHYTINNPESLMRVNYKPKLESSLVLQYKIRKQLSQEFELLPYRHYRRDLANYYINNIYRLIISNLKNENEVKLVTEIKRVVNYDFVSDSVREIGFNYKCSNLKEYLYFLSVKYKVYSIIHLLETKAR